MIPELILLNLKWLFSGIGVAILTGTFAYLKSRRKSSKDQESQTVSEPHTGATNIISNSFIKEEGDGDIVIKAEYNENEEEERR